MAANSSTSSDIESPDDSDDSLVIGDEDLLQSYNDLMTGMFPSSSSNAIAGPSKSQSAGIRPSDVESPDDGPMDQPDRPRTRAEKLNAKKKRRNERRREEKAEALARVEGDRAAEAQARPIPFRLFSSCPVQPLSVVRPPEHWGDTIDPNSRPVPVEKRERLHQTALEASIDVSTYFAPIPTPTTLKRKSAGAGNQSPRQLVVDSGGPLSEVMVCHFDRSSIEPKHDAMSKQGVTHIHAEESVISNTENIKRRRRTRSHRSRRGYTRPLPQRWSPSLKDPT